MPFWPHCLAVAPASCLFLRIDSHLLQGSSCSVCTWRPCWDSHRPWSTGCWRGSWIWTVDWPRWRRPWSPWRPRRGGCPAGWPIGRRSLGRSGGALRPPWAQVPNDEPFVERKEEEGGKWFFNQSTFNLGHRKSWKYFFSFILIISLVSISNLRALLFSHPWCFRIDMPPVPEGGVVRGRAGPHAAGGQAGLPLVAYLFPPTSCEVM